MSSELEIIRSGALNPAAEPSALQAEFNQIVAQPRILLAAAGREPEPARPNQQRPEPARPEPPSPPPSRQEPTRSEPTRPEPTRGGGEHRGPSGGGDGGAVHRGGNGAGDGGVWYMEREWCW